jgi:perosamine synthetase
MSGVNIDARVFLYPLSMMPVVEDKPSNKVSYSLYSRGINLPGYHDVTSDLRCCYTLFR